MSYPAPSASGSASSLRSTETIRRRPMTPIRGESQQQSSHNASIHILDDDSLLHIFYLYRPAVIFDGKKYDGDDDDNEEEEEEDEEDDRNYGGTRIPERWWYELAQVCQRWRKIILGSASYLDLCLVCTFGTPVADMLAHSLPLPLVIDFFHTHCDITTKDEKGIILALERRDRIRRVRLLIPRRDMWNLIWALGEEYPVLECLIMTLNVPVEYRMACELPRLQAPRLRHLILRGFTLPIKSRLLATAVGLVTLGLDMYLHNYFQPDTLLQILLSISLMPQLETLLFVLPHRNMGLRFRVLDALIMTQRVTLPNLRRLVLEGVSDCTEAVVRHIATPLLETLDIRFFDQIMLSVPGLFQFVNTTENFRFDCAKFKFFGEGSRVDFYRRTEAKTHSLSIYVHNDHLRWQVSSLGEIFNSSISPSQIFSTVEHLTVEQRVHRSTSERYDEVDRTRWRKLLRPFSNAKTLHVDDGFANEFFRIFPPEYESPDNGKLALELLPGLEELTYCGWLRSTDTAFMSSINDTRRNAGRLVTLFRPSPRDMSLLSCRSTSRPDVMSLAGSIEGTYGELIRSWLEAASESIPEPDSRIR